MFVTPPAARAALLMLLVIGVLSAPSFAGAQDFHPPSTCADVLVATTRGEGVLTDESQGSGRFGCSAPARRGERILVDRVIDGDTIEIATGERVRYVGIDAPEMRPQPEPFAQAATDRNRELVEGRFVHLIPGVQDRDRFGRLLRYVMVDGILVGAELVREGLAEAVDFQPGQPYAACYRTLEDEAIDERRGLWR